MMNNTKEKILLTALHLFAQDGYEAVSVSDIAGTLGMTKSALYKHYKNKRDIFDSILARMEELDATHAREFQLPEGTKSEMEEAYLSTSVDRIAAFGAEQFRCWTEDDFQSSFRKMLTLEQYRSAEMKALYQQYLVSGPLGYVTDLFASLNLEQAEKKAIEFYAPMFLFYSMADGAEDMVAVSAVLTRYMERLCQKWGETE